MAIRAAIFDLDETLLDRAPAWRYALEEAVISITGQRIDARPLVSEYRLRPWRHALGVVVTAPGDIDRCEELCEQLFYRSAMKRLLVHEGLGMALDHLRAGRVEMGAISREPHGLAIKQIESTGLDRFLTVLSATPRGAGWDVEARLTECLSFLERPPASCAFLSQDEKDRTAARQAGFQAIRAAWVPGASGEDEAIKTPGGLAVLLSRR